jgi:hypothetical protein
MHQLVGCCFFAASAAVQSMVWFANTTYGGFVIDQNFHKCNFMTSKTHPMSLGLLNLHNALLLYIASNGNLSTNQ